MDYVTRTVILEELERVIDLTIDPTRSDYGQFTGIQIHTPADRYFMWLGAAYYGDRRKAIEYE